MGILIGLSIGLIVLVVVLGCIFSSGFRSWLSNGSEGERVPEHLINRLFDRIGECKNRVTQARADVTAAESALQTVDKALARAASAPDPALEEKARLARDDLARKRATLEFELASLDQELRRGQQRGIPEMGPVLQYAIFAGLAGIVLWNLLGDLTPGTTPRSMITFLIAAVTVGIALILVLSTVVSSSDDRKERFIQGKEILTALLGVLGTIVGFYFGTAQDRPDALSFEPVVVSANPNGSRQLSTAVRGGNIPYAYEVTFGADNIGTKREKQSDGPIVADIPKEYAQTDVQFRIVVTDKDGRTGFTAGKIAKSSPTDDSTSAKGAETNSQDKKPADPKAGGAKPTEKKPADKSKEKEEVKNAETAAA